MAVPRERLAARRVIDERHSLLAEYAHDERAHSSTRFRKFPMTREGQAFDIRSTGDGRGIVPTRFALAHIQLLTAV